MEKKMSEMEYILSNTVQRLKVQIGELSAINAELHVRLEMSNSIIRNKNEEIKNLTTKEETL